MKTNCAECGKELDLPDLMVLESKVFSKPLYCDICNIDKPAVEFAETLDEFTSAMFPEAPDDTVAWLCYCLSQTQMALVIAMLEYNRDEMMPIGSEGVERGASFNQRIQRMLRASEWNDREDTEQALEWARKFIKEQNLG